jgi:anti-sigma B factor antagonist
MFKDVLSVDYVEGVCVATILVRELDSRTSERLSTALLGLLNEGRSKRFVLDFEMVRYMESSCFGALVTFVKWMERVGDGEGAIALANVSEQVRFLFAVTKLDKIFPLHRDVPSALRAMAGTPVG